MMLLLGPKRAGKGTIARVLRMLVGEGNVVAPTVHDLSCDFGLQPLLGKPLAIISDARFGGRDVMIAVERLLCISGEDAITIPRKHMVSVTMKLPTRFMFISNELPKFKDSSGALAGRFMVLRLTESFFGKENLSLMAELKKELPGILLWALAGRTA